MPVSRSSADRTSSWTVAASVRAPGAGATTQDPLPLAHDQPAAVELNRKLSRPHPVMLEAQPFFFFVAFFFQPFCCLLSGSTHPLSFLWYRSSEPCRCAAGQALGFAAETRLRCAPCLELLAFRHRRFPGFPPLPLPQPCNCALVGLGFVQSRARTRTTLYSLCLAVPHGLRVSRKLVVPCVPCVSSDVCNTPHPKAATGVELAVLL